MCVVYDLSMPKRTLNVVGNLLILAGVLMLLLAYGPIIYDEIWYQIKTYRRQELSLSIPEEISTPDSAFARLLSSKPIRVKPVNKGFSIVIEKIGVNAPIVADVPVTDKDEYLNSLKDGVAHALVSDYPSGERGNVYLFAHSALNFWDFGKYSKVFNLLRKVEVGDTVYVFYEGDAYVYEVVTSEVYKGWNTYPLTRPTLEPILTLQTCDPPGTTLNRLVVTAKLTDVVEDF
jgi:sortase A